MTLGKQILTILLLTFVSSAISAKLNAIQLSPQDEFAVSSHSVKHLAVRADDLSKDIQKHFIIIDVRSEEKYNNEHIKDALHFSSAKWDESFATIMDRYTGTQKIFVYCESGCGASKNVAERLREAGFEKAFYVHNGFDALKKLGLELKGGQQ